MITVEYIESCQICKIKTDTVDSRWLRMTSHFNQISQQTEVYQDSIELPWHLFIANVNVLVDFSSLYNFNVEFSSTARDLLAESIRVKHDLEKIDLSPAIPEGEIQSRLLDLGFIRQLTTEQKRNLSKLSRLRFGATFSVPGAGKTTEAIAFYLLHRKKEQRLVVICPKSAFPAWEEQLKECLKEKAPKTKRLTNGVDQIDFDLSTSEYDVFLISYQQFIRVVDSISKFLHSNQAFLFIDESHRMKGGERTDTGRSIQRVAHLPVGKLIMSGTPMPQGQADLLPQYYFLFPTDGQVDSNNVVEKIRRIYVRTTKNELLNPNDYPVKIFKTSIPFHESQRQLYNLIRSEELRQISGLRIGDRKLFRQLSKSYLRLLQVASNPSLLLKNLTSFPDALRDSIEYGPSPKLQYTALKARQLAKEGKKVLIWSGFVENVELLTQMLSDLGAKCIHGGVEAGSDEEEDTRERIIKDFHDELDRFVLVANPAACAEGISLHTVCHHAIYFDRNYNAAQFLQSMDRIHRLGLKKGTETTIEIVHSPDSIDDLVDLRLTDKVRKMSEVLEDASLKIEPVTVELDEDGFDDDDAKQLIKHLKGQL